MQPITMEISDRAIPMSAPEHISTILPTALEALHAGIRERGEEGCDSGEAVKE